MYPTRGACSARVVAFAFRLYYPTAQAISKALSLERVLAHDLGVDRVRVTQGDKGGITVELPSPWPTVVQWDLLPVGKGEIVPVGLDIWNDPIYVDLRVSPHWLLAGATQSGKTSLLRVLAKGLTDAEVDFVAINCKSNTKFPSPNGKGGNFIGLATDSTSGAQAVMWLADELMPAYLDRKNKRPLYVFLDDVSELVKTHPGVIEYLERLAQHAAQAKIKLVLATQSVSSKEVGSAVIVENMEARIVSLAVNANASYKNSGKRGLGAEMLTGRGDMIAVIPGYPATRFQAAWYEETKEAQVPEDLPWQHIQLDLEPRGGWNRTPLRDEWVEWLEAQQREDGGFQRGAIRGLMNRFGLSQSVAYRVKESLEV